VDWSLATKNTGLVHFTAGLTALRNNHPVFRRRKFFAGRPVGRRRSGAVADIAWFTPSGVEMTEQDWDSGFGKCVTMFLNGQGVGAADMRGEPVIDDSFLLCLNAHYEDIDVTLPGREYGAHWAVVVDTATGEVVALSSAPGVAAAEPPTVAGGGVHRVPARSVVVLQHTMAGS
jgi:glycogen operon protein